MIQAYPARSTTPELEEHLIRIQGAATSDPVNETARGVVVTRTGTGAFLITWAEDPGTYVLASCGLEAATPGDIAGHTVVFDTYDTAGTQAFILYNAADAAHDLATAEYINIRVAFKRTGV